VERESGRPGQPTVRTGIEERRYVPLLHARQTRGQQDDAGKQHPPPLSQVPADLGVGEAGLQQLGSRDHAALFLSTMDEVIGKARAKVHAAQGDPRWRADPERRLPRWTM
jgi:hypothetical protein